MWCLYLVVFSLFPCTHQAYTIPISGSKWAGLVDFSKCCMKCWLMKEKDWVTLLDKLTDYLSCDKYSWKCFFNGNLRLMEMNQRVKKIFYKRKLRPSATLSKLFRIIEKWKFLVELSHQDELSRKKKKRILNDLLISQLALKLMLKLLCNQMKICKLHFKFLLYDFFTNLLS